MAEKKSSAKRPVALAASYQDVERLKSRGVKTVELFTLNPAQIRAITRTEHIIGVGGGKFSGKGQPLYCKILTPFGWTTMGELKVGSLISNPTGGTSNVIAIHPLGERDIFKVSFADGTSTLVTEDHLWLARLTGRIIKADRRYFPFADEDRVDAKIYTTRWLKEYIDRERSNHPKRDRHGNGASAVLVPLTQPIEFSPGSKSRSQTVDPYVLGLLLGDGCLRHKQLGFSSADPEMIDILRARTGLEVTQAGAPYNWKIRKPGALISQLTALGIYGCLSHEKFIPECYKFASVSDRWEIIQGLMDTDGYADRTGHCSFTSTSERLANDVREILFTLGFKVTKTCGPSGYRNEHGDYVQCRDAFTLHITGQRLEHLFKLQRKCQSVLNNRNPKGSSSMRRMVSIELVGREPAQCITVDHPNQLYITDNCIVTHNSFQGIVWMISGNKHAYTCGVYKAQECDCGFPDNDKDGKPIMINRSYIYHPKFLGCVLRENAVDLRDWIREAKGIYEKLGGEFKEGDKEFVFPSGAKIFCGHYQDDDAFTKYAGLNIVRFLVEEATHIPNVKYRIKMLRSCCRSTYPEMKAQMMLTFNPGGVSHGDILDMFVEPKDDDGNIIKPGTTITEEYDSAEIYRRLGVPKPPEVGDKIVSTRVFMFSTIKDNPAALRNEDYLAALMDMPEEMREAYLFGNWRILAGEYFRCHDEETEVLTSCGFKPIREVSPGELVATLSYEHRIEFRPCTAVHAYDYDGEMLAMSQKHGNFMVTPNHRMYCEKDNGDGRHRGFAFCEADSLPRRSTHLAAGLPQRGNPIEHIEIEGINRNISLPINRDCPICGTQYQVKAHHLRWGKKTTCSRHCSYKIRWSGGIAPVSDEQTESTARCCPVRLSFETGDFCELLGWYLSEGCLIFRRKVADSAYPDGFAICQDASHNPGHVERIGCLLSRMGLHFRYDGKEFRIWNKVLAGYFQRFGRSRDKFIPRDMMQLPPAQLERILDALVYGDGHRDEEGEYESFFSSSKQLADDVQELGVRLGIASTVSKRGDGTGWVVCFWKRKTVGIFKSHIKPVHYEGRVYCLTVPPFHTMLTRRKGRLLWSGNSFRPSGPLKGEPPEANHVIPYNLAQKRIQPWYWATAAMDWGYSHECAFGVAFHDQERDQLWATDEFVTSQTEPDIVGEEVARRLKPILKRYADLGQEPMISMGLSHDAYGLRQDDRSVAELIAKGMARVVGPNMVHVPDLMVDRLRDEMEAQGQSTNTGQVDEIFAKIRQQQRMGITIRRMRDSRIVGWQYLQTLMRWRNTLPSVKDMFDPNLASKIAYEKGLEAYNSYLRLFQQTREILPKLQIVGPPAVCPKCNTDDHFSAPNDWQIHCGGCDQTYHIGKLKVVDAPGMGCPRIIEAIPKAMRDDKDPEDVSKKHIEKVSDVIDMLRYLVMTFRGQSMPEPFAAKRQRVIDAARKANPNIDTQDLVWVNRRLEAERDAAKRNRATPIQVVRSGMRARAMARGLIPGPAR